MTLQQLGELVDIRDSQGRRPPLSHVHRFRHTRGTSLINAGVPVHVVQRYKKITADAAISTSTRATCSR